MAADPNARARRPAEHCKSPFLFAHDRHIDEHGEPLCPFPTMMGTNGAVDSAGVGNIVTYQNNNNNTMDGASMGKSPALAMDEEVASDEELFV